MAPLIFILLFLSGADSLRTVRKLTVQEGASITIPCHYDQKYKACVKYWCQGSAWYNCATIVRTDSPQRKGEVSISDDPAQQVLTVTLSNLQDKDSGYYWFLVEINAGTDVGERLHLTVTEGTPDLSVVRDMVTGEVGGFVRVICHYGNRLKDKEKKWCRIEDQSSCLAAGGSGTSQDRVNLNINDTKQLLTVTVRELERKDTGWYWCSAGDLQIPVHINIMNNPTVTTEAPASKTPHWGRTLDVLLNAAASLLFLSCTIIAAMIIRDHRKWKVSLKKDQERNKSDLTTSQSNATFKFPCHIHTDMP